MKISFREEAFDEAKIVIKVPKIITNRTRENMEYYRMGLADAFKEAVRSYGRPSKRLKAAFMADDYREYIPSEYSDEYLDFEKYPLKYTL